MEARGVRRHNSFIISDLQLFHKSLMLSMLCVYRDIVYLDLGSSQAKVVG